MLVVGRPSPSRGHEKSRAALPTNFIVAEQVSGNVGKKIDRVRLVHVDK